MLDQKVRTGLELPFNVQSYLWDDIEAIKHVTQHLIDLSQWFMVTPCPDGQYVLNVKVDAMYTVTEALTSYREG